MKYQILIVLAVGFLAIAGYCAKYSKFEVVGVPELLLFAYSIITIITACIVWRDDK